MAISTNGAIIARFVGGLYNTVLSNATYLELVSQDPSTLANKLYAADFGKKTDADVGKAIVANLGLSALTGLDAWVAAQLTAAGAANKGAKIASMLNDFSAMTADTTYGTYATAFNTKVDAALASSQTTGKAEATFATAGVTAAVTSYTLTTGVDAIVGSAGDDTITAPATVATTGAAQTTINSGDSIDGGAGTDTLTLTITGANNNSLTGLTIKGVEKISYVGSDNLATGAAAVTTATATAKTAAADLAAVIGSNTAAVAAAALSHSLPPFL
jgi:S-layer protein